MTSGDEELSSLSLTEQIAQLLENPNLDEELRAELFRTIASIVSDHEEELEG